jgi:hypothetical protein
MKYMCAVECMTGGSQVAVLCCKTCLAAAVPGICPRILATLHTTASCMLHAGYPLDQHSKSYTNPKTGRETLQMIHHMCSSYMHAYMRLSNGSLPLLLSAPEAAAQPGAHAGPHASCTPTAQYFVLCLLGSILSADAHDMAGTNTDRVKSWCRHAVHENSPAVLVLA